MTTIIRTRRVKKTTPFFVNVTPLTCQQTSFLNSPTNFCHRRKRFHGFSIYPIQIQQRSPHHVLFQPVRASAVAGKDTITTTTVSSTSSNQQATTLQIAREILNGVYDLSVPLFKGNEKTVAWLWTIAVVVMAFAATIYAVMLSTTQKMFWNVLSSKDVRGFGKLMIRYAWLVTIGPLVLAFFSWVKDRLALMWRRCLTDHLLGKYFTSMSYYKLTLGSSEIDNPDQRIAEDVSKFTDRAVRFFTVIGVGIFDLVFFSIILYRVYSPLLYILLAYNIIGTTIIVASGRRLLLLNRQQVEREANFRYGLVRLREGTESVAFYGGEESEKELLTDRFSSVFRNKINLLGLKRTVDFLSGSWRYYAQVVPTVVIGPRYIAGKVPLGAISQVFFSFNHVLSSLGLIISEFTALAEFGAGIRRLRGLSQELDKFATKAANSRIVTEYEPSHYPARVKVSDLNVYTPSELPRLVIGNLNFEVEKGKRLLVVGRSGIGKSSLMRAICGLWDVGEGNIIKPSSEKTLFLSQRPFIMLGSLRENMIYPLKQTDLTSEQLEQVLNRVNLRYLIETMGGLDVPGEILSRRLSLGEQQRLAFARILISKPELVILDESTSALDLPNERDMYQIIEDLDITCISVGNRPSLANFHDSVLRLKSDGKWDFETPEQLQQKVRTDSHSH